MNRVTISVLLSCVALQAHAGARTFDAAGVKVEVPASWVTDVKGTTVTLMTKDQMAVVTVTSVTAEGVGGAALSATYDAVRGQVAGMVADAALGPKKDGAIGSMKGFISTGTGTISDAPVSLLFAVLPASSSKVVIVISIGVKGKYEKYEKELQRVLFSIASADAAEAKPAPAGAVDTGGLYDAAALSKLPEDARKAALEFARGVTNWDDPSTPHADGPDLLAGFVGKTVKVGKKSVKAIVMTDEIALEGPQAWAENYLGWMADSGPFHVDKKGNNLHIYRGSGYGETPTAILKKGKRWELAEIKTIDLGSP
ncbi:MAG: hypothetical protein JNL83_35505 [Myxococcales bacterium]|nr:hypothetical protein [Myxococcales bacterium]